MFFRCRSFRGMQIIVLALMVTIVGAFSVAVLAEPPRAAEESENRLFDFDANWGAWDSIDNGPAGTRVSALDLGRASLVARFKLTAVDTAGICLKEPLNLLQYSAIQFKTWIPKTSGRIHFAVYVVDTDDKWYQTSRRITVHPESWETVTVDLTPNGGVLRPVGHARPWGSYVAQDVQEIGIQFFSDRYVSGDFCLDDVELIAAPDKIIPQTVYNFETSGATVERYGCYELTFELSRTYYNPFDPDEIAVWGRFTSPSGVVTTVPGFFFQDYERYFDEQVEYLKPIGPPKWKIRFCPREEGRYTYDMQIVDQLNVLNTPRNVFTAKPSKNPGCVRVSPQDKRYFEFEDASFYYPIGHNIPAAYNAKASQVLGLREDRLGGTYTYDSFLNGMEGAHENYARIWLAAWSFGIEWTRRYNRAYRDLGRYNMENAWRFDYVLNKAARDDIYVQLALTTFGHWCTDATEGDWRYSPYNRVNGGSLTRASEFWTDEPSQKMYDRMLRYVMARWGYATHIVSWEISNEINLVDNYEQQHGNIVKWHQRCIRTIREFDQNPHLITTNFSAYQLDPTILALPEISYSSTNNYNPYIVQRMQETIWPLKTAFGKPAIMAECGYDFKGAGPETTTRYIHLCLWGSYMVPFAGAGMSWWWDFIEDRDLYGMFTPLTKFAEGEELRGRNLETGNGTLQIQNGGKAPGLEFLWLKNKTTGYFWIYEMRLFRAESDAHFTPVKRNGIVVPISGLNDGSYRIEFWDTYKGEVIETTVVESKGGSLLCPVPTFTGDIAGKIRPVAE